MITLFLKKSPFIRIILPFMCGIYISNLYVFSAPFLLVSLLLLLLCFFGFNQWMKVQILYQYRHISGLIGFLVLLFLGAIYLHLQRPKIINSDSDVIAQVQVISKIGQTEKNIKYEVYLRSAVDSLGSYIDHKGIVYLPEEPAEQNPTIGDYIVLKGRFIPFSKPDHQFAFDYSTYLKNHRITFRIISNEYRVCPAIANSLNVIIQVEKLKEYISTTFKQYGLAKNENAILNALFLGDKSKLSYEQKDAFSDAGAMHLLAVSGLHVGIIYLLLLGILRMLNLKDGSKWIAGFVIITLWMYALITGFSPSVLRASIMFTILEIGRLSQLKTGIFNLLGASMFIILLIEPLAFFNIGFWLSHCAVASIVCFYPKINNWICFRFPPFKWIWSIVAVSLSAQIGTLPISIYAFHEFPLYFLLANVLLIPIVTPLLVMAVLASVFSTFPIILKLIVPSLSNGLSFMENVANAINSLPYSTISNLYVDWWQLIFIYFSVTLLLVFVNYRFFKYLRYLLISLIILILSFYVSSSQRPSEVLFVANIRGKSVVNYISNNSNEIYSCSPLTDKEIEFAFNGLWAYCSAPSEYSIILMSKDLDIKPVLKFVNNERILIVPPTAVWTQEIKSVYIDRLIVMNKPLMTLEEFYNTMHFNEFVMPNGWNWYQKKRWLESYTSYRYNLHDIYKDGVIFVSSR